MGDDEFMKVEKQPTNIEECHKIILDNSDEDNLNSWLKMDEESAIGISHHGIGRGIRNEFHLWEEDNELVKFFNNLGIKHADDMSGMILTSLHRKLNGKDMDYDGQIKGYKDYWRKMERGTNKFEWIQEKKE